MWYIPSKALKTEVNIYDNIIAHRGYHCFFPENSIPAFKEAINRNYGIEFDVRMTKDGELIVFHDQNGRRLLGVDLKIKDMTYDEILKFSLCDGEYKVSRLEDVLDLIEGKVLVLIEIKGFMNEEFEEKFNILVDKYRKEHKSLLFFHCKEIRTYFKLRKKYGYYSFWVLNPLRKRFPLLKVIKKSKWGIVNIFLRNAYQYFFKTEDIKNT